MYKVDRKFQVYENFNYNYSCHEIPEEGVVFNTSFPHVFTRSVRHYFKSYYLGLVFLVILRSNVDVKLLLLERYLYYLSPVRDRSE